MVDLERLYGLLNNDKQVAGRFLDLYIDVVPGMCLQLGNQIETADYQKANVTAHEIKSQSAYLGLDEIVSIAAAIEDNTETDNTNAGLTDMFRDLSELIDKAISEIKELR